MDTGDGVGDGDRWAGGRLHERDVIAPASVAPSQHVSPFHLTRVLSESRGRGARPSRRLPSTLGSAVCAPLNVRSPLSSPPSSDCWEPPPTPPAPKPQARSEEESYPEPTSILSPTRARP